MDVRNYQLEQKVFSETWSLFKTYAQLGMFGEADAKNLLEKTNELSKQYKGTKVEALFQDISLAVMDHIVRINR